MPDQQARGEVEPICPKCAERVEDPPSRTFSSQTGTVVALLCPECGCILGVVNLM